MSACIHWRRLLQSFFILIPAWFSLAVTGNNKPEIDVYLNKYSSSMEKPAGIVYWSFEHPSIFGGKECSSDSELCDKYIKSRIRMLTEYSAFLSQKNIYPEAYLLTGIYQKDIAEDFVESLEQTTYDSYLLNEKGEMEELKPENHAPWKAAWIAEKGLLVVYREPLFPGKYPVTTVSITANPNLDSVTAGEAFTITLRLRYDRKVNILLYRNAVYSAAHFSRFGGQPWSGDSLSGHPAILGLQQGIIEARKFFGENSPFLVATTLNLPVDQPEIRQHLKENLAISLNFTSPVQHSFNPGQNQLARLWSDIFGGIDFAGKGATSALVDMVGLHDQQDQQDLTVKMRVIPFESVQTLKANAMLTTFDRKPHRDNCFISEKTSVPGSDELNITCMYDSVASPSGNEPVYAEVSFSSMSFNQFHLPGVYAPLIKDDQYDCNYDLCRRIIDFAKHRQLPGSILFVAFHTLDSGTSELCGKGRVCGQIIKISPSTENSYKARFLRDLTYLGSIAKTPQGEVIVNVPKIVSAEAGITIPHLLCNVKAEKLQSLTNRVNTEYQHDEWIFQGQVEGKYLMYNIFYKY